MSHPINQQVVKARTGTVVRRELADIVRLVPLDGVSSQQARLRFSRELVWLRSMEYEVVSSHGEDEEDVDSHGHFVDVGRPLDSLDEVIETAAGLARRRKMGRKGEVSCKAMMSVFDHALIEVPQELHQYLYASYQSGADPVYLPVGDDWLRVSDETLDVWLALPWHERDASQVERLREPRSVFSGAVWSSRWTDQENVRARAAAVAVAVP